MKALAEPLTKEILSGLNNVTNKKNLYFFFIL